MNLRHILPTPFDRNNNPYRFYHIPKPRSEDPHGSPEQYYEASPHLPTRAFSGYSPDNSQLHTNPPPDFSNSSMRNMKST